MSSYRLVLADDHSLLRSGLKRILAERNDIDVVGEARDGIELLDLLKQVSPHLVILDISMPRLRGLEDRMGTTMTGLTRHASVAQAVSI